MTAILTFRPPVQPQSGRRRVWAGGVAGVLGAGEITASCVHPGLAVVLAIADAATALIVVMAVAALIVYGSDRTWERIFRLLRWASGRAEPPAPPAGR